MTEYTVKELIHNHEKAFLPEAAEGVEAVIQYRLTGEEAGDYIINIHDGKCVVEEGITEEPDVTLTADARDFADVLLGKANGMQYFMTGKLKLSGDLNLAMKLTSFFKMA
ncbi:MAG: SCP2 sterol-binding domain-containing protein [Anaerolineales bacterium]|jgi:putative sterol carrier protein|nr:SCP2 sterol-binding domain-containing protein [Anaerolineales bacterium]